MQRWMATSLAVASAPLLLTGCAGDDLMSSIGMPASETEPANGRAGAAAAPVPGGQGNAFVANEQQRGYLDALVSAGVKPSSELAALSIGSYVCQARAAKQDDQEVWAFVLPLVRQDVRKTGISAMAPSAGDVHDATADYIRIATERLC